MTYRVFLRQEIWSDSVELVIFREGSDGQRYIAKPLEFELVPAGLTMGEPTARFHGNDEIPKQLKHELNMMGYIDHADAGTIKAKDAHLEDMRRLVFEPAQEKTITRVSPPEESND